MNLFFEVTEKMRDIFSCQSMFEYKLDDTGKTYVIQYLRDDGQILVCEDQHHPREGQKIAADTDKGKALTRNILRSVKWRLDNDAGFMLTPEEGAYRRFSGLKKRL